MSSNTPFEPSDQPEFLAQGPADRPRRSRTRLAVLAGVGLLAAGAVGVGAWGVAQLTGGGPGAAAVLPDTTLAYASLDLDPSAGQKIEGIKTLKKFPGIAGELDLDSRDDIRAWFFGKLKEDETCEGLDYASDVEPWIGDKAAVAALPNDEHVADVVFAVQVTDEDKAKDGIAAIFRQCDGTDDGYGVAFLDGYMLVAENDGISSAAVTAAKARPLADDPGFQAAMESLGDLGVVTAFVSPEGPKALYETTLGRFGGMSEGTGPGADHLGESLKDFQGAAATVRFADGAIELAAAGKGVPSMDGAGQPSTIADLPETTVAALGLALPEGWLEDAEAQLREAFGEWAYEEGLREAEAQTGLQLPEDVETLFGDGAVLAVDGSTEFDGLFTGQDPSMIKAGLRVQSEEPDVRRIVNALLTSAGPQAEELVKVRSGEGRVAIGFDDDYLDTLLAGGDLGTQERFTAAVTKADTASVALFVDFDAADGWLDRTVANATGNDPDAVANAKPLDALGASAWTEGETAHLVVRLSTD